MGSTLGLLRRLLTENVEFVVVGGFAAIAHGSAAATEDVDVCVRFDLPTLERNFRALAGTHRSSSAIRISTLSATTASSTSWVP